MNNGRKIWFVSFDKQRADEPIFINRNEYYDKPHESAEDQARQFKEIIETKGYRTKVWWQYE